MGLFDKVLGNKRNEIKRGRFGEPHCSDKCYNKAGKDIADRILVGISGVCAFYEQPVKVLSSTTHSIWCTLWLIIH